MGENWHAFANIEMILLNCIILPRTIAVYMATWTARQMYVWYVNVHIQRLFTSLNKRSKTYVYFGIHVTMVQCNAVKHLRNERTLKPNRHQIYFLTRRNSNTQICIEFNYQIFKKNPLCSYSIFTHYIAQKGIKLVFFLKEEDWYLYNLG